MFKSNLNVLKFIFLVLPIALVCVVIWGLISPWATAENSLGPELARKSILISYYHKSSTGGERTYEYRRQTYLTLPDSLMTLKTISVVQENGTIRTEENPFGLIKFLAICFFVFGGTWWFWFRLRKKNK